MEENVEFNTAFTNGNSRPLFTFDGDVYNGIDAFSLDDSKIIKAQSSLKFFRFIWNFKTT